jgi:hypothetical protein
MYMVTLKSFYSSTRAPRFAPVHGGGKPLTKGATLPEGRLKLT